MKKTKMSGIKAFTVTILVLILAMSSSAVIAANTTKEDIMKKFNEDKKRIGRTDQEIKDTMNKVVSDLKKKNKKFTVELNEMMK